MPLIIYNPKSKNGKPQKKMQQFIDTHLKNEDDLSVIDITTEKDLNTILSSHDAKDPVYLLGGDGTLNYFINQTYDIHPLGYPITLIPIGSGNDFYRTLKKSPDDTQHIFALEANSHTHYFLNGMGFGIDGEIGAQVNLDPKKRRFSYLKETLKALITYQPETAEITVDGVKKSYDRTYLVVASNGQYFGSGMKITPRATLRDNDLDVVIVHSISRLKILLIFLSIYVGAHLRFKRHVTYLKAAALTATFPNDKTAQTDGETFPNIRTVSVRQTDKKTAFRTLR